MNILFADDNPSLIEILKRYDRRKEGQAVRFVDSLRTARLATDEACYDRVIVDRVFEGEDDDGLKFLEDVRSKLPYAELVLITGRQIDAHDFQRLAQVGALLIRKSAFTPDLAARLFSAEPVVAVQDPPSLPDVASLILENEMLRVQLMELRAARIEVPASGGFDAVVPSCFISHSSRDDEFAKKLYYDLQANGINCWFAPEHMSAGDRVREKIDESIYQSDRLVLILSRNSITSQWVEAEVEAAFEKERRGAVNILIPLTLDAEVFETRTAWAAEIRRTRHIGDFCGWQDSHKYDSSFQRLLSSVRNTLRTDGRRTG